MKQNDETGGAPSAEQLNNELKRLQRQREIRKSILGTIGALIVVAAAALLVLNLWIPLLQVQRNSMSPTLRDGDIVAFITTGQVRRGDIIAFYHGNQVLIKRVIGVFGDNIDIGDDGMVILNGSVLDEPYISERHAGEDGTMLPAVVTDNRYFVMGDYRQVSIDSRNDEIGMIHKDQIIGKALIRIWPPESIGILG